MIHQARQAGYILLPVIVVITLVAAIALLMNTESALESNTTASELDAQQARYVAEAGLNHALWLNRQQSCGPYGNLTDEPLGNDKYTSNLTTDLGSTNAVTINVDQDSWIRSDQPTINKGLDLKLHTRNEVLGTERPLLRYDLSPIAANASILSATAWFYVTNAHAAGPIDIHLTSADWTETDATWDSMNANMDSTVLATIPSQPAIGLWLPVNLTALVQAWVNGQPNFGITLNSTVDGVHGQYNSRESANPPYLEVVVGVPPSSPATLNAVGTLQNGVSRSITRNDLNLYQQSSFHRLQLGTDPGADAMLDSFYDLRNYGGADYLQVHDNGSDWQQYPLIRFELSGLPAGASVHSARLELRMQSLNAPGSATVHQVSRSWVEGTKSGGGTPDGATWGDYDGVNAWTSAGGDYNASAVAETAINGGETWVSWEIAPLVERWLAGEPNHGLLIKPDSALDQAKFASKEDSDATVHPKLTITYACACGQVCLAPQGSGNLLMAVIDPGTLVAEDQQAQELFESWGYTVSVVGESSNQAIYDAAVAANDVVFISETVNSNSVGSKLAGAPIGVVSQDGDYNPDLGLATGSTPKVGDEINITDTDHYITRVFAAGPLPVYAAGMEQLIVSSAPTAGQQVLADIGGDASLVVLEQGAAMEGGGNSAGRRVVLPLGTRYKFNWDYLNANGRLIVQRALQWGTGNTGEAPALIYRDEFTNRNCDAADYTGSDGALDWSLLTWVESGDDGLPCGGSLNILEDPVVIEPGNNRLGISGNNKNISRSVDLTLFTTAYLSFDYRRDSLSAGGDRVSVEIWDDGAGVWVEILLIAGPATDASYLNTSLDITPYISPNAAIRLTPFSLGGGITLFIDNLQISETPALPPPLGLNVLLTVGNATTLASKDVGYVALMESWGHSVTLIDDGDSQANFDAAAAVADVVYVSGTSSGPSLLDKLTGSPTPIVNEINGKLDNFGFSSSSSSSVTDSVFSVTNASHYISEPFAGGPVTFFTTDLAMPVPGGTLAPGLQTVGETAGAIPALVTLDAGAQRWDATPAPARRVHLPFTNADASQLTADGETLMQRAIEWAGDEDLVAGPIAHWKLDDGAGLTAVDSASTNDGTLNGPPAWVAGAVGDALDFDGTNDYVAAGTFDVSGSGITMMGWFNAEAITTDDGRIVSKANGSNETDAWWQLSSTDVGADRYLRMRIKAGGTTTTFADSSVNLTTDQWYFAVGTYDSATGGMKLYLDGVEVASGSHAIGGAVNTDAAVPVAIGANGTAERFFNGVLDDVQVYDYALGASQISDYYAANPPPGASSYTELYQAWSATGDDTWQTVDLSAFGVPANAVVEVAVVNSDIGKEYFGGVRTLGSSLERRFALHEAEGGGVDTITMHVQADASSQIQHYSDRATRVSFILLGYWTGATYVERFDAFKAGANASWQSHDLGAYGVGANQVAEIAMSQTSTSIEWLVGARSTGSILQRRISLHEAQGGGIDMVTLMAGTDASSMVEVYAEADSVVDFHLLGYWNTPPGTYTETGGVHGQATVSASWQATDLSGFGIPANSVAQFVMSNERDANKNQMGLRETGSTIPDRRLDLQEAEAGGSDLGSMHVKVDADSQIQWVAEYGATEGYFYPVGWWVLVF